MALKKTFTLVFSSLLLCACAGDPPKTLPVHLRAGTEQIRKGNFYYQKGCYKRALEHFIRANELYTASDQPEGIAMSLNNIGSVYRALGDAGGSMTFFDEAERIYLKSGGGAILGQVLSNKAAALIDLGDLARAEKAMDRAWEIQASDQKARASLLTNRGILLARKERRSEAESLFRQALALNGEEGAATHFALGNLLMETGRQQEAAEQFEAALKADRSSGFYKGIADDLARLGHVAKARGNEAEAFDYWERSLKIYTLMGLQRERDETAQLLKSAPQGTKGAGDATSFFLNRWEKGKRLENPCED